jgi:hypothetical protein
MLGDPYDDPVPEQPGEHPVDPHAERPLSALPSPAARAAAFVSILLGGLAGGLIGYSLVRVQCDGECAAGKGLGALVGAVLAAIGMSIVAILVLRAVGEWKTVEDRTKNGGGLR